MIKFQITTYINELQLAIVFQKLIVLYLVVFVMMQSSESFLGECWLTEFKFSI